MSKKLPLILAAMLAVLAVPTLATDAAAPATDAAAPATDAAAPAADAAAPAKKAKKHRKKHKTHGAAHSDHSAHSSNTPQGSYRKSYDENCGELPKADCDPECDKSPVAGPRVQPGHKVS